MMSDRDVLNALKAAEKLKERPERLAVMLNLMLKAWADLQPDLEELQCLVVGANELVDSVKRELAGEATTQVEPEERDLLARLVDAWDHPQADMGLMELRNQFVEIQGLIDQARGLLAQSPPKEEPRRRLDVLVVEPHEYIRRHIGETLRGLPNTAPLFDCTMTNNPDMVMGHLEQQSCDIVLLAFGFKLGGSTMLLRTIRGSHRLVPVLMLGASSEQAYLTESLKNGASGYLVTDAILDELVESIRVVVAGGTYTSKQMRGPQNHGRAVTPGWEGAR